MQDWRTDEWMSGRFSDLDDETLRGPLGDVNLAAIRRTVNTSATAMDGDDEELDDDVDLNEEEGYWHEEEIERERNFGFTNSEINELLSHGVKPWDDNAEVRTLARAKPPCCGPDAALNDCLIGCT